MKKIFILLLVLIALCSTLPYAQAEETEETETQAVSYTAYASDLTVAVGSSKSMTITYTADTENADTPTPTNVTYYSADEAIAVVSDSGVVTGVSGGTTTVTAYIEGVDGVSQVSCTVTVTDTFQIVCSNKETSSATVTLAPVLRRNGTAIDATFDFSVSGDADYSDTTDVRSLTLTADDAAFLIVTVSVSSCEEGDPADVSSIHVYVSFYETARVEATVDADVSGFYFDDTGVFSSAEINSSTVSSVSYYSLLDLMAYGSDWDLLSMSLYDPDSTVASVTSSSATFYPSITNTLTAAQAKNLRLTCLTAGTYTFTYTLQDSYTELTLLSGKVVLTIDGTDSAVEYTTHCETPVTLDEDDFIDYWSEYYDDDDIYYVVFTDEPNYGTLYVTDSMTNEVDSSDVFYFSDYGYYELSDVTYLPDEDLNTAYDVEIPFTIYGEDTADYVPGVLMIHVEEPLSFADVDEDDYFYDAVRWAVNEGVTEGTSSTRFSPNATCTRAQVVTFLWRAAGEPEPDSSYMPFTDVDDDAYYYEAVLWAVENDITNGITATTFCPNDTVTRGQVVTFLWRAAGEPSVSTSNPFTDVSTSAYYYTPIRWAVKNDITNGLTSTKYGPDDGCTRAQIVTFLYRCYENL